ncbi:MAG: S1C family serine protease [Pirellulaceae bacterium]|nr:S1C family serine protease [Pirellulaceae bacterium]
MPASSPESARRTPRTWRGSLLRGGAIAACGLLLVWLVATNLDWSWLGRRAPLPPNRVPPSSTATATRLPAEAADLLRRVEPSVVLIEAESPRGLSPIGAGFVVDSRGLIATSLHVSSTATSGVVRFRDGAMFEIAGYAAVDREHDLALLVLRGAADLSSLALATGDPPPLSPIIAIGHPQGALFSPFDGKVSRVITTSELAPGTRRFVSELTGSQANQRWIQHTANLSDGNSGGPLVNLAGEAIGINTWVDRQTGFGYALHAAAIAELLARATDDLEPLARHATSEARLQAQLWQTSADNLRELHAAAQALRWRPASRGDYARLQELAWGITIANRPDLFAARAALGDRLDELVREADRVVADLRRVQWNDIGAITLLNEHAAAEVGRPLAGLVFLGTIERVVSAKNGDLAAIMRLAGFETRLLVPLPGKLNPPAAGAQCLVVGVNDRGRTVQYGDNPLDPIVLPVLVAPVVLELEL